jgi:very-short-patch-repair endonuclease/transposase-like protein
MYSYISNHLCFEYFVGYEITSLLGYTNVSTTLKNVSKSNQLEFREYPGVKEPELDPRTILITRDGVIEILIKTRKRISPDVLHILNKFQIKTTNMKCLTKEQQTLSAITNTFKIEKFEDQFKIGTYYLDLYFTEYKIVIECDENGHADRKPWKERERMNFVNENLGIDDSHWIRFNPDEHDFDISKIFGQIYRKIDEIKEERTKNIIEEKKREEERLRDLLDQQKKKQPVQPEKWPLQIEEITGKFTAPPKEYLLKILETQNISDIAMSYGISTNPVSKWLDEHGINIKDFHNYNPPPKDELVALCKGKTQTEIALHYKVSNHIIRKWFAHHKLDFLSVKTGEERITKDDLIKLVIQFSQEEIAEKLNMTLLNLQKLLKVHSIDKIPSKEELEEKLILQTKDELAKFYNTSRTTLRKWIRAHGIDEIRCTVSTNKSVTVIREDDNTRTEYPSVKDACIALKIGKNKVNQYADKDLFYRGYKFQFCN